MGGYLYKLILRRVFMEKKKVDLAGLASGAGKATMGFLSKTKNAAVNLMDQNDDGKFDLEDVSKAANSVGESIKNAAEKAKNARDEKARAAELAELQPIFEDDITDADFSLPKFIRVAEIDEKRKASDLCKGSIGFYSDQKDFKVISIYPEKVGLFGLSFYPDLSSEFYYVDPSDRDRYIALSEYFNYLKLERVNELQRLALDLGAKYFKVVYREEKASETSGDVKAGIKAKAISANAEVKNSSAESAKVDIAAEMKCVGHEPQTPTLKYLKNDPSVDNLIRLRFDKQNPISHHHIVIQLGRTSGVKETDAIKIDAALKGFKYAGSASAVREFKNEERRYLEYEIVFE